MLSIVDIAEREIGYCEQPMNSNCTKYGAWFGLNGLPWCGMFVSWVYYYAGRPLGNIGYTNGFAGCQTAVAFFRKQGRIVAVPEPGDIVFFDWNNDGRFDHCGIFVEKIDGERMICIEGNTSPNNQSNGGTVMKRWRGMKGVVFAR